MSEQSNLAELERRIAAALARIETGMDRMDAAPVSMPVSVPASVSAQPVDTAPFLAKITQLKAALLAEQDKVAQANERLKSLGNRETLSQSQLEAKVEKMTQQLDIQGLELQRMRKSTAQLREQLRLLHEAAAENVVEPNLINKAMQAELESLRVTRHTETAEMDEILAELKPLIEEVRANG